LKDLAKADKSLKTGHEGELERLTKSTSGMERKGREERNEQVYRPSAKTGRAERKKDRR